MAVMTPNFLLEAGPIARMFAIDPQTFSQVGFILVNVAVLAFVMSKLLYKPVTKILEERKARIHEEIETAEKDKVEALKLKEQYEKILKDVEQEKLEILESARKVADERKNEQLAEARTEAENLKNRAKKEIEQEQERAKSEMKQAVIDASSAIAAKFLARNIDAATHEQLFNETMAELEEVAWHS